MLTAQISRGFLAVLAGGGSATSSTAGEIRRWRVHLNVLFQDLPTPFDGLGRAAHFEVVNVHDQKQVLGAMEVYVGPVGNLNETVAVCVLAFVNDYVPAMTFPVPP